MNIDKNNIVDNSEILEKVKQQYIMGKRESASWRKYKYMSLINDGIMQVAFNSNLLGLMKFYEITRADLVTHNEMTKDHDSDLLKDELDFQGIFDSDFK
tara:strand:- start:162 stop:458 length:297 start_codon:yes stop_codon:yes gene_type:complete